MRGRGDASRAAALMCPIATVSKVAALSSALWAEIDARGASPYRRVAHSACLHSITFCLVLLRAATAARAGRSREPHPLRGRDHEGFDPSREVERSVRPSARDACGPRHRLQSHSGLRRAPCLWLVDRKSASAKRTDSPGSTNPPVISMRGVENASGGNRHPPALGS